MRLVAEVALPCNVTQTMKYSVHHMQICELWRYYLNYRAIVDFGISDTASPAFNCSNSDLCVQRKCSGSVGTASFRQFRGCNLHVVSFFLRIAERCSRIIAKPPSESAVKARFYNLTHSLQQITNDGSAFPALFPRRILTLVSNCRNLRSASPSFSKDDCIHTVKSVLRLAKRSNNVTPRISAHKIHFSHAKKQQNDSCIKP